MSAPASPHPTFPSLAVAHAPSVRGHLLRWASRLKKEISLEVDYRETWSHGWLLMRPAAQRRTIRRLQTMGVAAAAARADDAAAGTAPAALSYRLSLLSSISPYPSTPLGSMSVSSAGSNASGSGLCWLWGGERASVKYEEHPKVLGLMFDEAFHFDIPAVILLQLVGAGRGIDAIALPRQTA